MQIKVNNQFHQLRDDLPHSLADTLSTLIPDLKSNGIAVALNNQVVPRKDWQATPISNHDKILIITATQGG
ncbi:sulfur carrier protein ThiS [Sphingobacterium tabacisoli]|uniref:Sulfur carrier protein ThiS n=1 Tax=Sphingobacterium tabacisoli TaxID=2044855 RepID=A0ABW5L7A7_9SPHI|nr:sulfur carrier protein ThiS [Sphingobacterium tabacisoli]